MYWYNYVLVLYRLHHHLYIYSLLYWYICCKIHIPYYENSKIYTGEEWNIRQLYFLSKVNLNEFFSQMDQLYIFRVSVSVHELFVPSYIHGSYNKTESPPLTLFTNVMIEDNKSFWSLWTWFLFLGWELYNFTPTTSKLEKQVLPILYFCAIFL